MYAIRQDVAIFRSRYGEHRVRTHSVKFRLDMLHSKLSCSHEVILVVSVACEVTTLWVLGGQSDCLDPALETSSLTDRSMRCPRSQLCRIDKAQNSLDVPVAWTHLHQCFTSKQNMRHRTPRPSPVDHFLHPAESLGDGWVYQSRLLSSLVTLVAVGLFRSPLVAVGFS